MKNITLFFHILFSVIFLFIIAFPPFYAVDTKSNGKILTSMGYYPIWSQPTSKDAYYSLVDNKVIEPIVFENYSGSDGIGQYSALFNIARFIINAIIAGLFYILTRAALKYFNIKIKHY